MLVMDKKPKQPKDRHKWKPIQLRLPPIYKAQLEKLAKKTRRTVTEEAKIALEEYLAKFGLWELPKEE